MKLVKKYFPQIFLALLCLLIIGILFKDGKFLATGEAGLMLVNPDRSLELYKYSWIEVRSGVASPGWNVMIPLFYAASLVIEAGVPLWLFQATLFFLLMLAGAISIFCLSKELFSKIYKEHLKIKMAFLAALFYILNPVSLLTVWNRGIAEYAFIFFYALAPLFFYLYILGINNRKIIFIIIAPLVTLIFSAFASPAPPLLLWFFPFIYSSISTFVSRSDSKIRFRIFPPLYFIAVFAFWILISLWWIFPYIELSKTTYFADETNFVHAVNTLKANSKDFTLENVVRLIHGGFLYRNEAFGPIYKSLIFFAISWLIPVITIYGLLKLKKGQIRLFFASSLILLIFLAKGTSAPFGGVFLWLFSNISILQVFRNPFEKFGLLLPIIYAPLFGFGLFYFLSRYRNLKVRISILLLIIIGLGIYNWPFFTGALANFGTRDIRIEVPSSFMEANKTVPTGDHIILSIPGMGGASGFYKWEYGYKGVEVGPHLFNYPVVSDFYDSSSFYGQLLIGLSHDKLDNNLIGLSQFFSADIIAYRQDLDVAAYGYNLDALERSAKMIESSHLIKLFDSPQVQLWRLPNDKIVPVVYTPHAVRFGDSPSELIELLESKQFDPKLEAFICTNNDKCSPNLTLKDSSAIHIDVVPEKIEFMRISPVNYNIKVKDSKGRFLLVFNNNYHPGWTALIGNKPLSADKHIVANGYANGFIIDRTGSFDISLRFVPEENIQKSYIISAIAAFLGVIILLGLILNSKLINRKFTQGNDI